MLFFLQFDPVLKLPINPAQLHNFYISSQLTGALKRFSLVKVAFMMMLFSPLIFKIGHAVNQHRRLDFLCPTRPKLEIRSLRLQKLIPALGPQKWVVKIFLQKLFLEHQKN